ncbi:PAS domain-containing protein [Methanofollis tationis]|uniref:PAS domain-containing protein n=1 Tax=Methanofollis tationis TaxID=81417 RepID=A0A7K4HRT8_9EURY|nr:PAS domain-containing protein [Methanofollis tationis]NVO67568.1 PAS domain-containing protein [Methanofollis tationis]
MDLMEPLITGDRMKPGTDTRTTLQKSESATPLCILDALPVPVMTVSGTGSICYMNPLAASLFGVDPNDAIGEMIEDALPTGIALSLKKLVGRTADFSVISGGTIRHAYRDYSVHTAPMKCGDGSPATVIVLHPMAGHERLPDLAPKTCPDGSGHWVPIFVPAGH